MSRFFIIQFISALLPPKCIDFCTYKKNIHTKVQPQHGNNDGRQTSVNVADSAEMADIKGKSIGIYKPAKGAEYGSFPLLPKLRFSVGQKLIDNGKENGQKHQRN